jgi:hypothetical protein
VLVSLAASNKLLARNNKSRHGSGATKEGRPRCRLKPKMKKLLLTAALLTAASVTAAAAHGELKVKHLLTTTAIATAIAACLLAGTAAHALTPEETAKADIVRDARQAARLAFQTKASKAEYNKIVKTLDKKVPGRSCDADDWELICEMEDGRSISVQAVPVNTSEAKAAELCTNPYADAPDYVVAVGPKDYANGVDKTKAELKGNPKWKFLMLWCTTEARDWSVAAAEERKQSANPVPVATSVIPEIKITNGKLIPSFGSVLQAITVKNNTSTAERQTFIECGFFLKGELVGTGLTSVGNLMPGATKYATVIGLDISKADKVACNVKD